jgi:hypothetical protein
VLQSSEAAINELMLEKASKEKEISEKNRQISDL